MLNLIDSWDPEQFKSYIKETGYEYIKYFDDEKEFRKFQRENKDKFASKEYQTTVRLTDKDKINIDIKGIIVLQRIIDEEEIQKKINTIRDEIYEESLDLPL